MFRHFNKSWYNLEKGRPLLAMLILLRRHWRRHGRHSLAWLSVKHGCWNSCAGAFSVYTSLHYLHMWIYAVQPNIMGRIMFLNCHFLVRQPAQHFKKGHHLMTIWGLLLMRYFRLAGWTCMRLRDISQFDRSMLLYGQDNILFMPNNYESYVAHEAFSAMFAAACLWQAPLPMLECPLQA